MKKITRFTKLSTGEGVRISYTFSEIDENGLIISQNNQGNFVVNNEDVLTQLNAIEQHIQEMFLN